MNYKILSAERGSRFFTAYTELQEENTRVCERLALMAKRYGAVSIVFNRNNGLTSFAGFLFTNNEKYKQVNSPWCIPVDGLTKPRMNRLTGKQVRDDITKCGKPIDERILLSMMEVPVTYSIIEFDSVRKTYVEHYPKFILLGHSLLIALPVADYGMVMDSEFHYTPEERAQGKLSSPNWLPPEGLKLIGAEEAILLMQVYQKDQLCKSSGKVLSAEQK